MSKQRAMHETPPLRLRVGNAGLSPVTQFDAERLASYRNGSEVWCSITQDLNWKLVRKYWAILGKVVKDCPLPAGINTTEQLSNALKMAYGHTDPQKTLTGQWRVVVKSLNDFTSETEFEAFFEASMVALEKLTGVDPLTLRAESDQTETSGGSMDSRPDPDAEPGPAPGSSLSAAADLRSPEGEPRGATHEGDDPSGDPVTDLTHDEVAERLGGQPEAITARSIILHMSRFVAQQISAGNITPDHRKDNVDTLNLIAKGYGDAFRAMAPSDQESVKTSKALLMNFVEAKAGFDWPSVRRRITEASSVTEEEIEDL